MDALVDLIKRIGIFMIAAQAVIHFAPEEKYGKYMKLIVSIMILLQFLTPVYRILSAEGTDWLEMFSDIGAEYPLEDVPGSGSTADALIDSMEKEIKSKLNDEIADENYRVENVRVSLRILQEKDVNGFSQYELNNVRVVVMFHTTPTISGADAQERNTEEGESGTTYDGAGNKKDNGKENGIESGIEKIQIQKIGIGTEQAEDNGGMSDDAGQMTDILRQRFAQTLGIGEEYMEVSVYGAVEESLK